MSLQHSTPQRSQKTEEDTSLLILPFTAIDATMLSVVGGKAANLGELIQAGLPVPGGFCITTIAYTRVSSNANLEPVLDELMRPGSSDITSLETCAASARAKLQATPLPHEVAETIIRAYRDLGGGEAVPVAVRSSATAEDLPFASFAGQQDTYLNVVGEDAVLEAVRRCWVSLWTDRAVNYRTNNGIDHRSVRLAVVVQCMVDAKVAGVLFTANPLTGHRHQVVIDASPGLGEAVVSGAVNPDHFVVNKGSGEIVERHLGDKQVIIQSSAGGGTQRVTVTDQGQNSCLTDEQIADLTKLGMRVEAHYQAPQDTEWAIDGSGQLWLTQARPITTLYPLPANAPSSEEDLRVYLCFNVLQGVYRPFTPMGFAALRLMASSIARSLGFQPENELDGPASVAEAGHRLFLDMTPMLRNPLGRKLIIGLMGRLEARSGMILKQQAGDPRLAPVHRTSRWQILRRGLATLARTRVPLYIAQVLFWPTAARERVLRLREQIQKQSNIPPGTSAGARLITVEYLLLENAAATIYHSLFTAMPAFLLTVLAGKILGDLATSDERQVALRALPYNPTTEMDLALWQLAQQLRKDVTATQLFLETPADQLVQSYHAGTLPPALQQGLADFLKIYGHRGVAEIDLGLPRWSEDPTYILGVLTNYLQLENTEMAPDAQFQKGVREAEAMVTELVQRARKRGWLQSKLVSFCLRRGRALAGMREVAKYYLVLLLAGAREILLPVGEELKRAGRLEAAEDIFFINLSEARYALAGADLRQLVDERRLSYERELVRRHVPRILLSNGTEPEAETHGSTKGDKGHLKGIPASAGTITAKARVILDPVGAHLEPGEILIAPSTDPGWTPLFLTASGMVMEMGGPMSHGAVVAREYGIPAVVGVPDATRRIKTGQSITVDGSTGTVIIDQSAD